MSSALDGHLAKPRDTVETPLGRVGLVVSILNDGRREIHYLDKPGDTVSLRAELLRVLIRAKPRPWQEKIKP